MKQAIAIILMLLALGSGARAVIACARLMCPTSAMACCCQETAQDGEAVLALPMNGHNLAHSPGRLHITMASTECCTVSSVPSQQDIHLVPKVSGDTLKSEEEARRLASRPIVPELMIRRTSCPTDACGLCPGRSEIYLLVASLRI